MKKKMSLLAMAASAMLLLGGCGTQMYSLSEDEENLIVQYSAHILGKYNLEQKDGITAVTPETETAQEETQTETQTTQKEERPDSAQNGGSSASGDQTQTVESISIAKAIGHAKDLKVSYKGYTVKNIYQEGDYFAVTPDDGNKLIIMKFTIKNTGKKTVKLDTVSKDNPFYVCYDGQNKVEESVSLGVQSLSSYEGKIKAGQSKTAVLLFQVPDAQAKKLSDVELFVELDGTIYSVNCK